ncbi:ROK family transcriptional regulator [Spirochaeta isovalerica]|uniref:Putative NBD/HSP70 family sugar kinase n=1 Tax=Spirochaeta isovalerica TaxID=150 RepID=A0A841RD83_9SPIO|nr:ROK family transcriptional regulator [Spirochaeta isovalerica]MBB6481606.1 putative NBD/HSP70 family sugar kinase [Spirochaeta isovalerica]
MNQVKSGGARIRRQYNLYRVLRAIWVENGVSRKELCAKLELDKATMSTIVSLLLKLDIVEEVLPNIEQSKPGRKPIGLGIRKDFGYVAGFELHVKGIKAVIKDMHFNTIETFSFPCERLKMDQIKSSFLVAFSEVKKKLKNKPLIGIGVSIPGVVDHDRGIINNSWELGVVEDTYDFQSEVFDILDIPGFIDNDANCCAWGKLTKNRSRDFSNFLYTFFSYEPTHEGYHPDDNVSVGLGLVMDGKPYFGPDYTSGEFQTMTYNVDRINQFDMTREEQYSYRSDPDIQRKVFESFSNHMALLVNFFNFKRVIMGGDLPDLVPDAQEILRKAVNRNWPYGRKESCLVETDEEREKIAASGAAGMFLEQMFTVPEFDHERGALTWQKVFSNKDLTDFF